MDFFLCQILARVVAACLFFSCGRTVWRGLTERKISYFNDDLIDGLLIDWSKVIADRDAAPVRYWIQIGLHAFAAAGCLGVAIFGWWRPNA